MSITEMKSFRTVRQAKDYLAHRIVEEARLEGVSLSEIERKMLYFSETDWTLPDMVAASQQFGQNYDQDEYEDKIAGLIRRIQACDEVQNPEELEAWDDAVLKLCEGDHYLLTLIDAARPNVRKSAWLPVLSGPVRRQPGDTIRLVLAALVVSALCLLLFWVNGYLRAHAR